MLCTLSHTNHLQQIGKCDIEKMGDESSLWLTVMSVICSSGNDVMLVAIHTLMDSQTEVSGWPADSTH